MSNIVINIQDLSKSYRLGQIGTGMLSYDIAIWWARIRGKPNPLLKIGQIDHGNRQGDTVWALKDVSFTVEQGEVLGIIGRNGAGKSTLLKILSRVTAPTSGKVMVNGRIASLLEVGTGFHPDLTGRENIFLNGAILGMRKSEVAHKFDEIVDFAEIEKFLDTPVKRYSSGMYVRLAFAVAAHLEPEILLVDEVLAVGDAAFQKKCLGKMGDVAKGGRTVLFVSHNMAALQNLCSSAIFLDHGQKKSGGNLAEAIMLYNGVVEKQTKRYLSGPIREVSACQFENFIVIKVKYQTDFDLYYPGLGFVISDYMGYRILGTSLMVDDIPVEKKPRRYGTILVKVCEPKLFNGTYRLGVWFGNGILDFFSDEDCLTFDVINMASLRQHANSNSGPVYPKCEWLLEDI